ncbi:hypothetical protein GCM10022252_28400 [Streptosporangium oxazolinicum]|uniref:Uncharacterized protein n=1 Tax=Streptosporangium oxazolinicum TaxID=909287 RepID=A0ABP8AUH5_9ACTN
MSSPLTEQWVGASLAATRVRDSAVTRVRDLAVARVRESTGAELSHWAFTGSAPLTGSATRAGSPSPGGVVEEIGRTR